MQALGILLTPFPQMLVELLERGDRGYRYKGVAPAVPHLVLHIPLFIACRRVAELRPEPVMEHKPGESLCKLPFPILQHLDYRCGQIVKSQPGRYSPDVFKDPLQPFQQTFLVL